MIQFDKATILLRSLTAIKTIFNHPDWEIKYRKSDTAQAGTGSEKAEINQLISYRYSTPRERRTSKLPHLLAPSKYSGIHDIEINMIAKTVKITVTSKLLSDPRQMLTQDNFQEVWDAINATKLLDIDSEAAHAAAGLLSGDITLDLRMMAFVASYVRVVARYYTGNSYRPIPYGSNMLWQSVAGGKRHKRSLTFYDKSQESKEAHNFCPNTLRLELRLTSLEMLRRYLGLEDKKFIPLESALAAQENPVATAFQEILAGIQLDLITAANTATLVNATGTNRATMFLAELDTRQEGIFLVLQRAGFNLDMLRTRLKGDKNASRLLAPYREMLTDWTAFAPDTCQDAALLRELITRILPPANITQPIPLLPRCPGLSPPHPAKTATCVA